MVAAFYVEAVSLSEQDLGRPEHKQTPSDAAKLCRQEPATAAAEAVQQAAAAGR